MALLPVQKYFVINGEVKPVEAFIPSENEGGVYEVLRVVNGVPLFLEDHLERFYRSAGIAKKTVRFSEKQVLRHLEALIASNKVTEGNILISCKTNLKAFFIPHNYPADEQYEKGVVCGILRAERENPNAKVFQTSVRKRANQMIAEHGFYEVLLVDHLGRVTEGSRSNVFFVKRNRLLTPPGNEVLLGITRQKTFALAQKAGVELAEKDVYLDDLAGFDAAFITGTSPKLLPVQRVGAFTFDEGNKTVRRLMGAYNQLINDYVREKSR